MNQDSGYQTKQVQIKFDLFPFRCYRHYQYECRKVGKPSLFRAVVKTFWKEFTVTGVMYLLHDIGRLAQPLLLGQLLLYFR